MTVTDASTLVNNAAKQFAGFEAVAQEDLSNIVDFGRAIEDNMGFDVFFGKLADQFNTIKFWSRPHVSFAPNVWMETEKYGAIRAMYRTKYMESQPAEQWDLQNGVSYDPFIVNKNEVLARFWSKKFSSSIKPQTIVREQLESAFRSETELMSFIGMLELARTNTHGRAWDELIMSLFQAIAGLAVNAGGMQDIKLLTEFNTLFPRDTPLTATNALFDEVLCVSEPNVCSVAKTRDLKKVGKVLGLTVVKHSSNKGSTKLGDAVGSRCGLYGFGSYAERLCGIEQTVNLGVTH